MIGFPGLKPIAASRKTLRAFGGYDHNLRLPEGAFYEMENMTSDHFPLLATRPKRSKVTGFQSGRCIGMYYVPEVGLFYALADTREGKPANALWLLEETGEPRELFTGLSSEPKQFAMMGKHLIIVPDMIWVRMGELAWGTMEESWVINTDALNVELCLPDGTTFSKGYTGTVPPENPEPLAIWLDNSTYPKTVRQYSAPQQTWVTVSATCFKIFGKGLGGHRFQENDGIHISGLGMNADGVFNSGAAMLNGCYGVRSAGQDYLIFNGVADVTYMQDASACPVTLQRKVPKLDFLVEAGNRLWGCARDVNEIYATRLGDHKNWNSFMGISTDSWVGSVGTPGEFTGAVNMDGYPVFYKEGYAHKVWPGANGAHRITSITCTGVERGSENSIAQLDGVVFYKSPRGICADSGSGGIPIDGCLGDQTYHGAVGAVYRRKYYVCMQDAQNKPHLFVYDTQRKLWHRENIAPVSHMAAGGNCLYADPQGGIWDLTGSRGQPEETVFWSVQTGDLGLELPEQKYVSRLTLRLSLEPGAKLEVFAMYDREPVWISLGTVYGTDLRSFSLPVRPRRCDQLRLKLQGQGQCRVYSLTKTLEKGSELV